ncbi:ribonuclease H-like domain-containing protein [Tanacetum coccineum]
MSGTQDENPPPPPPQQTQQAPTQQQSPHTVSTIKLPTLKKGEYDIWAMKIEHYLAHTDYPIWEVIQNGNGPVSVTTDTAGQIKILPPKTAEEIVARERERRARTTLLMAIPEDHLAKFHKMTDAKEIWNAIKSRFGGNDESKKMQKYILKQQFEGFIVSNSDGIHKGYERFQSLLSQLEIHGAGVSTEDANQKFLRSLPSAWLQVSLIMRNKPGIDSLSFDDLYNNLRVFENDVKSSTASSSNLPNVAFVSENTSSTNDVSTAYGVPITSGHNTKHEQTSTSTSSYSLLASHSSCPQLDHEDLDQVDEYDLEEMDLKWQVAMISMRIKKFYNKTGRKLQFDAKEPVGFDKTKVECYNCHKTGHFARECRSKEENRRRDGWNTGNRDGNRTGKKEESKALVTVDGESIDWTTHSKDDESYFMLSAVPLDRMSTAVAESFSGLKPGLCDMTMLRFEADQRVRFREYKHVDVTRSYFFSLDSTRDIFLGAGFIEVDLEYCCVKSVNRCKQKTIHRVWVHGKFQKPMSHIVQQAISQAVGDMRMMSPSLMNSVSLVENYQSCRKNRDGQKSRPHTKHSNDQDGDDSDADLADLTDLDNEEDEDEYDQLPLGETKFKNLKKNRTSAGMSVMFLGENVVTGFKRSPRSKLQNGWSWAWNGLSEPKGQIVPFVKKAFSNEGIAWAPYNPFQAHDQPFRSLERGERRDNQR